MRMSRVGLFGQISDINDHLFLSGAGVLRPEKMKQKRITCVINATTEEPNAYLPGVECIKIRIDDNPYAKLHHYFDMVADKIRSVKERGGKTLVHCVAGVSRSASLCIVYLIKYEKMSLRQAYHYVKSARPIIRPNVGFWQQMCDYEKKLRGHTTVTMIPLDGVPLPFPDVYSSDLRKYMAMNPCAAAHNDPQVIQQQQQQLQQQQQKQQQINDAALKTRNGGGASATFIPIEYGKRRGLSAGNMDSIRNRHSAGAAFAGASATSNGGYYPLRHHHHGHHTDSASPWRHVASISLLSSPAPIRRSVVAATAEAAHHRDGHGGNLFSNIYNTSREAFFPAF